MSVPTKSSLRQKKVPELQKLCEDLQLAVADCRQKPDFFVAISQHNGLPSTAHPEEVKEEESGLEEENEGVQDLDLLENPTTAQLKVVLNLQVATVTQLEDAGYNDAQELFVL